MKIWKLGIKHNLRGKKTAILLLIGKMSVDGDINRLIYTVIQLL